MTVIAQAQGGVANLKADSAFTGNNSFNKRIYTPVVEDWHILSNHASVEIPRAGNGRLVGPGYGLVLIREGYHDGSFCIGWIYGSTFTVIHQTGASWSNTTTPAADKLGIAWDAANNFWRVYSNFSTGLATSFLQVFAIKIS
jgi:hypothetical protein